MSFSQVLASLAPIFEPIILQEWNTGILPLLQARVAALTSPDEKLAASAFLTALDTVAKAELAKLA